MTSKRQILPLETFFPLSFLINSSYVTLDTKNNIWVFLEKEGGSYCHARFTKKIPKTWMPLPPRQVGLWQENLIRKRRKVLNPIRWSYLPKPQGVPGRQNKYLHSPTGSIRIYALTINYYHIDLLSFAFNSACRCTIQWRKFNWSRYPFDILSITILFAS